MSDHRSHTIAPTPSSDSVEEPALVRIHHLLDDLPDAILCLDRDWHVIFANAEGRRISRLSPAGLHSKSYWELYPDTIGTPIEALYREVMQTRVRSRIEQYHAPFDIWLDVNVLPTDDGIALHSADITARKQAEAARDDTFAQFHQILNLAPDSIVCIDREWNCSFFNHAAAQILRTDDLLGANLWTRFPLNQQEPFASNYRLSMEQRVPTDFEAYYPKPLDIWFKVWVRPYEGGIIIFSSDISDRKRAVARRDATGRQLQQVLEATSDAVVSVSRDWTITFLNAQAVALLGRIDLIGRNLWEEFPAAADSDFNTFYNRTMHQRVATDFEAFYPDPLNAWFSIQCRPSEEGMVVFFRDVTAGRNAKNSLLEKQAALSFVQQIACVATWELDLATDAITFDHGSFPVFGRSFLTINTLDDLHDFVQPDDLHAIRASIQRAIETNTITTVDYKATTPAGDIFWLEDRALPIFNAEGVAIAIRGMTTDITARKRDEEKLASSEARYRVLTEINPQAIWMGAPDGSIIYANQGFLDYIGKTIDGIVGLGWLDAFDPIDRKRVVASWAHSVTTGTEYAIEAHLIRARDGASRIWSLRGLPVRDESGAILHWLGVANDIHDLKIAAETLRQKQEETERQRAELETIYQTAPVGLGLFDPIEYRYIRLNDRLAEIIGLPVEKLLGRTLSDISPPAAKEVFDQVIATNQIQRRLIEGEFPNRPGEKHFFNVNYAPVFAPDGSLQAIATATLDITHQKKAELALIQSEKLAAVGRLASSISHEINNPLEAITNLLFLTAMDESLPDTVKTYIHMAQSELSRVSQIATQTLRFHRQAVKPTLVSASELVTAVLNLYQGRLSNSAIRVNAKYATSTQILCFENDIRQVLNNLIANAIDAMRTGGQIVVRAHDTVDATTRRKGVRITIADTGHGMPPDVRNRIFEPFYTTKDLNGTGLGLWISSGIVDHHHGSLTVRSSQHPIHHGTIFSLFLPSNGA